MPRAAAVAPTPLLTSLDLPMHRKFESEIKHHRYGSRQLVLPDSEDVSERSHQVHTVLRYEDVQQTLMFSDNILLNARLNDFCFDLPP